MRLFARSPERPSAPPKLRPWQYYEDHNALPPLRSPKTYNNDPEVVLREALAEHAMAKHVLAAEGPPAVSGSLQRLPGPRFGGGVDVKKWLRDQASYHEPAEAARGPRPGLANDAERTVRPRAPAFSGSVFDPDAASTLVGSKNIVRNVADQLVVDSARKWQAGYDIMTDHGTPKNLEHKINLQTIESLWWGSITDILPLDLLPLSTKTENGKQIRCVVDPIDWDNKMTTTLRKVASLCTRDEFVYAMRRAIKPRRGKIPKQAEWITQRDVRTYLETLRSRGRKACTLTDLEVEDPAIGVPGQDDTTTASFQRPSRQATHALARPQGSAEIEGEFFCNGCRTSYAEEPEVFCHGCGEVYFCWRCRRLSCEHLQNHVRHGRRQGDY